MVILLDKNNFYLIKNIENMKGIRCYEYATFNGKIVNILTLSLSRKYSYQ